MTHMMRTTVSIVFVPSKLSLHDSDVSSIFSDEVGDDRQALTFSFWLRIKFSTVKENVEIQSRLRSLYD